MYFAALNRNSNEQRQRKLIQQTIQCNYTIKRKMANKNYDYLVLNRLSRISRCATPSHNAQKSVFVLQTVLAYFDSKNTSSHQWKPCNLVL